MKQIIYIQTILVIAVFFILQSFSNPNERHIGEWKGIDHTGMVSSLILDKSNNAILVQGNRVLGGKDFEMNGMKLECKYEIDYSKRPVWLDIIIYKSGTTQEKTRFKGIVQFITDTKIQYRVNFNDGRYSKFDMLDKENTIVFDKVTN